MRSKDGKYSAGIMGLIQLESAVYNQEANYNTNNDLSDGFIVRRAGLTLAGVSEKDWIWFLSYDYADSGDNPHDGLRAAMAIYRGFKPWWLFVGLFGNSVGLDASNFSSQRQFMEAAMPQATFIYGQVHLLWELLLPIEVMIIICVLVSMENRIKTLVLMMREWECMEDLHGNLIKSV